MAATTRGKKPESMASGASSRGVAWGGDRFVAVGGSGAVHSRDGIRWRKAPDPSSSLLPFAVAWSGDRFVAVGWGDAIIRSSDGNRWEEVSGAATSSPQTILLDIVCGGDRLVAVGVHGR